MFTPSSAQAAPPLKPFAQRGTLMPNRPNPPAFKQPDIPRRVMDIPGHPPRRPEAAPDSTEGKKLVVGREIQLSGEINACDHLVVEGKVAANLTNASMLEVAETGEFKGTVVIAEADISGRFEGEMTVSRRLVVRPTGVVAGVIRYAALSVEEGGRLQGSIGSLDAEFEPPAA
ncbi:bactofilin family protein, partial [Rhodospirillum rubrum]